MGCYVHNPYGQSLELNMYVVPQRDIGYDQEYVHKKAMDLCVRGQDSK